MFYLIIEIQFKDNNIIVKLHVDQKWGQTMQYKESKIVKSISEVLQIPLIAVVLVIFNNFFSPPLSCRHCVQGLYL